jgi:hypothetical protein
VLDAGGIDVASGAGIQRVRAVESGGSVSLVVWTAGPSGGPFAVRARRIDASGSFIDVQPLLLGSTGADGVEASVGHAGSHFLVAWENSSAIDAAIVGHDGHPGPTFTIQPGDADSPSVGADGSQFLVAWRDVTSGYKSANIVAARVTELGGVLDDGFVVSGAAFSQSWPSVGSAAGTPVVTWEDSRHSDPEYPLDDKDIYAATISSAGVVGSEIRISREHGQQLEPVIAAGADQTLIAWSDFRSGRLQVFATRLSSAGSVLDPDGFIVSRR